MDRHGELLVGGTLAVVLLGVIAALGCVLAFGYNALG